MKTRRFLTAFATAVALTVLGLGSASTQGDNHKDKPQIANVDYEITGGVNPVPGHSFPKSWGRLVNYIYSVRDSRKILVFEGGDGTIRMVRINLDWDKNRIQNVHVLTVGRE